LRLAAEGTVPIPGVRAVRLEKHRVLLKAGA